MLTNMSPLLYWYTFPEVQLGEPSSTQRIQALENSGIQASALHDLMAVYSLAPENLDHAQRTIFILEGVPHQLFAAVSRLRTINPNIGIIVLCTNLDEQFLVQLLHGGVDGYAPIHASDSLILALVNSVWRRQSQLVRGPHFEERVWTLTAKGWVLVSPKGQRIDLTTTERRLLIGLFSQPERRADHFTLLDVLASPGSRADGAGQNRLGVIISRLKKKAENKQVQLPLRSVHRWGYMFSEDVVMDDDVPTIEQLLETSNSA